MTIDIRGYRASDLDQVASLLNRVLPDTQPHNEPIRSITTKQAHDDLMFVATTGSSIVGFIMAGYDGHRGWIYSNRLWFGIILALLIFTSVSAGVLTSRAQQDLAEYEAKVREHCRLQSSPHWCYCD